MPPIGVGEARRMLLRMLPPSPNAPAHCVLTCLVVEQMPNTLLTEQMKMCTNSRMGQFNRHEYVHLLAVTTHQIGTVAAHRRRLPVCSITPITTHQLINSSVQHTQLLACYVHRAPAPDYGKLYKLCWHVILFFGATICQN
jgi:hypothetical protein